MKNKSPNVFIVEDNLIFQHLLSYELSSKGLDVTAFTKGEDAISALHHSPDVVVLDYSLEGTMNGMDVLKAIKSINASIQVIILSAQSDLEVAINTLKYGAFDYVEKTDNATNEIITIINKFIAIQKEAESTLRKKQLVKASVLMASVITILIVSAFKLLV